MKGNEFLEKMELIDPAYVEAADVKPEKRKNEWVKWLGVAACVCIVGAAVLAMPRDTNDISYIEPTISGDLVGEAKIPEFTLTENYTPYLGEVGDIEPATEPITEPYIPDTHNGAFYTPNNMEAVVPMPMISSYGEVTYVPEMTVDDGEVHFSESLLSAMEHYGDGVNYRVLIEFFKGGKYVWSGGQTALDEMHRLSDLGYIVAYETYVETEEHGEYVEANAEHYFTIHATYEQLQNFAASEGLGYSVMLYDEYFGRVQPLDAPVVNHGFHAIDE